MVFGIFAMVDDVGEQGQEKPHEQAALIEAI
jgi:hypothetical protein